MNEVSHHLVDAVFPHVSVRQWVISFPFSVRYALAYNPLLVTKVLSKDKRYKRGIRVGYPLKTERNYAPIRTDPPHSGPRAGGATAPILHVRKISIVFRLRLNNLAPWNQ